MAKQNKKDQTNVTEKFMHDNEVLYDSHIVKELIKYVDGKPERLQYLRQCLIPFFDMVFFAENVEGGEDILREVFQIGGDDHV